LGAPLPRLIRVFELRVLRTLSKHAMLDRGDAVLVAVSGGADSTALLVCLHRLASRLGIELSAAHLNHGLRESESDEDEAFVRALCSDVGIRLISGRADVRQLAHERRRNLEDAARLARYEFLRGTARSRGCRKIAVGHNLNDQAESVLFRFLRGSGEEGISGIHPVVDGLVIRPLLETPRKAIEEYLVSLGRSWREDSTNRQLVLRRNRLRHEVLPYLAEHFNPRVLEALARNAVHAREVAGFLDAETRRSYQAIREDAAPGFVCLPVHRLVALHPAIRRRLLRLAISEVRGSLRGITAAHADDLMRLCASGTSGHTIDLPGRVLAGLQFGKLVLERKIPACPAGYSYTLPVPGSCVVPEAGLSFSATLGSCPAVPGPPGSRHHSACLDADRVPEELLVRSRLPGDRYGGPGHRKVKKMLIDARIPLNRRAFQPMVVAGGPVVWVPGFVPAAGFRGRPGSARCVIVEANSLSGGSGQKKIMPDGN